MRAWLAAASILLAGCLGTAAPSGAMAAPAGDEGSGTTGPSTGAATAQDANTSALANDDPFAAHDYAGESRIILDMDEGEVAALDITFSQQTSISQISPGPGGGGESADFGVLLLAVAGCDALAGHMMYPDLDAPSSIGPGKVRVLAWNAIGTGIVLRLDGDGSETTPPIERAPRNPQTTQEIATGSGARDVQIDLDALTVMRLDGLPPLLTTETDWQVSIQSDACPDRDTSGSYNVATGGSPESQVLGRSQAQNLTVHLEGDVEWDLESWRFDAALLRGWL